MDGRPLVASLAILLSVLAARSGRAQDPSTAVDALVERYRSVRRVPGIAVGVVRDGRLIKAQGYGVASLELGTPVSPRTLFGLGSISKQFTATAVMQLVEAGKARLDDPITAYLDSLPASWSRITVRHLLTHTSGLPEEQWLPNFVEFDRHEHRHLDVLRTIFADTLDFAPGARWAYRNSAFRLLGMLIERVSGESYWGWLDRRILGPVGMTATRSSDPKSIIPHRAKGYGRERGQVVNRDAVTESAAFSEGALMSSVVDLATWDSSLYRPTVLTQASLDTMWTPVRLNDGARFPYGFGWAVAPTNGVRTVSHGGSLPGFKTQISRFLGKRLTVIVLTNAEWSAPDRLAAAIAGIYEPELAPRPDSVIADPDPELARRVRSLVEGLARGDLDRRRLAPEALDEFPVELVDRLAALVRPLGGVRRVDLLARHAFGDRVWCRYRVEFERGAVLVSVTMDGAGRIGALDLEEPLVSWSPGSPP